MKINLKLLLKIYYKIHIFDFILKLFIFSSLSFNLFKMNLYLYYVVSLHKVLYPSYYD